jgi:hypothetical protein
MRERRIADLLSDEAGTSGRERVLPDDGADK